MDKLKFETRPVTEEEYKSISSWTMIPDAKISDYMYPLVFQFPNPIHLRTVSVSIMKYGGFPHYWTKIREEENHAIGLRNEKMVWLSIGHEFFDFWDVTNEERCNIQEMVNGKDFVKECNTIEEAEAFIKEIIAAHFSDEKVYRIDHEDKDMYTDNFRDGD